MTKMTQHLDSHNFESEFCSIDPVSILIRLNTLRKGREVIIIHSIFIFSLTRLARNSTKNAVKTAENAISLAGEASQTLHNVNESTFVPVLRRAMERAREATEAAKRSLKETKSSAKISHKAMEDILNNMKEPSSKAPVETFRLLDDILMFSMVHTENLIGKVRQVIMKTIEMVGGVFKVKTPGLQPPTSAPD